MSVAALTNLEFLYLSGSEGRLFAVLHAPSSPVSRAPALLFVQPFAEEMNKSRRMVTLQARALASRGCYVLNVDPYGCGDSEGELRDASWSTWLTDLKMCAAWLEDRSQCSVALWGLRLGALLALDAARRMDPVPARVLLWQPLLRGGTVLKTLLRQRVAAQLGSRSRPERTDELRARLAAGETLELSGYQINSALAESLERASLESYRPLSTHLDWLDVTRNDMSVADGAGSRLRDSWAEDGSRVTYATVLGEPFWASAEIVECPALIEATNALLC